MATIGQTIDGEPTVACQALALKRALVQLVADAGMTAIDQTTMNLLNKPIDLAFMQKFGGGTTAHATTRATQAIARVGNFAAAQVENHLADIDVRLKALGGS